MPNHTLRTKYLSNISRFTSKNYFIDILSAFLGLLLPLTFSPFNCYYLIFFSLVIFIFIIEISSLKRAIFRSFLFGLSAYSFGVYWIYLSVIQHGNTGVVLSVLLTIPIVLTMAFHVTCKILIYKMMSNIIKDIKLRLTLVLPAIWIIIDWVQSWFLIEFTNTPWMYVGYCCTNTILSGYAPLLSVYGVTFIVILISSLIYLICKNLYGLLTCKINKTLREKFKNIVIYLTIIILIFYVGSLLSSIAWTTKNIKSENIAIIQGNISNKIKWSPEYKTVDFVKYITLSKDSWHNDTIIWPETAIASFNIIQKSMLEQLDKLAKKNHGSLIFGIPLASEYTQNDRIKYYNSIMVVGRGNGIYHKKRLVPWGEFVPYENFLRDTIPFFSLPMTDFIPGDDANEKANMLVTKNITWIPFICYEIIFPDDVITKSHLGDVILVLSNDDWLGDSIGPWQHLQMAQMRAIETGRYVIRSTNNGVTAIINPSGRIEKMLPQFKDGVLESTVYGYQGNTPIMLYGVKTIIGLSFILVLLSVFYSWYITGRKNSR